MNTIYVVGQSAAYIQMFIRNGWAYTDDLERADAIQFTGGEDVDPSYYGEVKHPATGSNPLRDSYEGQIYLNYLHLPKFGICRGSQFLCVSNGGSLWQDVDNHAIGGGHTATTYDGEEVLVSSTHHQMMRFKEGMEPHEVLMTANLSTRKEGANHDNPIIVDGVKDIESMFFPLSKSLCYQPHPEFFDSNHPCQYTYFRFIKENYDL